MTERLLDLTEIQGNILGGFNTDFQVMLVFSVVGDEFARVASWLATLADQVTSAARVKAEREKMKAVASETTWLCLSLGWRFLSVAAPDVIIQDEAFIGGMAKRAPSILGDKSNPTTWVAGNDAKPVDVFFIVAGNHEAATGARADALVADAQAAGLRLSWRETARRLDGDQEHFGFRDGISQPLVAGYDAGGDHAAGHFVFGYPRSKGGSAYSPVIDPRGITDNGSLLVWRRLGQKVQEFNDFCDRTVNEVADRWPGLTRDRLRALLVGRWPSGAPLAKGLEADPGASADINAFDFAHDEGAVCPFGAHIRKLNPRAGQKDVVDIPRILRRGIPYVPKFSEERPNDDPGLIFLAFQSSIRTQFEFLTQRWMNSPSLPVPADDLLIGRRQAVRSMKIPGPHGNIEIQGPAQSWIVPTGGAYLFTPSRSGIRQLAGPPATPGLWNLRAMIYKSSLRLKGIF